MRKPRCSKMPGTPRHPPHPPASQACSCARGCGAEGCPGTRCQCRLQGQHGEVRRVALLGMMHMAHVAATGCTQLGRGTWFALSAVTRSTRKWGACRRKRAGRAWRLLLLAKLTENDGDMRGEERPEVEGLRVWQESWFQHATSREAAIIPGSCSSIMSPDACLRQPPTHPPREVPVVLG